MKITDKNIFINRMLGFYGKFCLSRIHLKVKALANIAVVNTLAQKELSTFSGDKWVDIKTNPIKYIKLVQCYFFPKVKISSDLNLSTLDQSFTYGANMILRLLNVPNRPLMPRVSNIVFWPICFGVNFDSNNRKQYNCLVLANSKIIKPPYFCRLKLITSYTG